MATATPRYEIQQDNAGCWRVIYTGADGVRRALDNPPCRTQTAARQFIRDAKRADADDESNA